jgi:hypothetical protein
MHVSTNVLTLPFCCKSHPEVGQRYALVPYRLCRDFPLRPASTDDAAAEVSCLGTALGTAAPVMDTLERGLHPRQNRRDGGKLECKTARLPALTEIPFAPGLNWPACTSGSGPLASFQKSVLRGSSPDAAVSGAAVSPSLVRPSVCEGDHAHERQREPAARTIVRRTNYAVVASKSSSLQHAKPSY